MGTIEKVKYELARIGLKTNSQSGIDVQSSLNILMEYFENSPDFRLIEQKDGLSGNGYFDSEEDDSNKYRKYKAVNDDWIVKITISDFRKILVGVSKGDKFKGYSLKLNEQSQESIPEYRIV